MLTGVPDTQQKMSINITTTYFELPWPQQALSSPSFKMFYRIILPKKGQGDTEIVTSTTSNEFSKSLMPVTLKMLS